MRVEQYNQFKDFFDRQNSFFEDMRTQTKVYKQEFEDLRVLQHKYVDEIKANHEITHQAVLEINNKNEQKFDYLCWGVQQINPYLKGKLPEDIPEWMQGNVQAGMGHFTNGMSDVPRNCWPGATSASKNKDDKGKGKAEEEGGDERGKKKAWEARDKDLNE
ncbi:hypothetical protein PIB30_062944 [Stylosanthes scabra]|uniref:Uncharacterized protein n=1 Tax=Stylosanthes scabra TaxID=79078 RepID=A0ABU6RM39_9FABA|nr:hypothetical protein [Stylosanthes scabra]